MAPGRVLEDMRAHLVAAAVQGDGSIDTRLASTVKVGMTMILGAKEQALRWTRAIKIKK